MMDSSVNVQEALSESLTQVLEEAAFMFGEAAEEPPPFEAAPMTSTMSFTGEATGKLYLSTDVDTCLALACDLMGAEEGSLSKSDGEATLGELLNIVAGLLVQSVFGEAALIQLHPPVVEEGGVPDEGDAPSTVSIVTDMGQRFDFALEI